MKLSTRVRLASLVLLCCGLAMPARAAASRADALPAGALKDAPSLYLREAAGGPIRWQPWSDAAFALARKLKRPVLVDVGAMWCHWCHVMDQTTYANARIAELINRSFVPIKVDTDERPDIDNYYQAAAQSFDAGGWPLTCFVTATGAPLFIAGYLPPTAPAAEDSGGDAHGYGMIYVLERVRDEYAKDPNFAELARKLAAKLAARPAEQAAQMTPNGLRERILAMLAREYDRDGGGFSYGPGPRFYDFSALRLALAHGFFGHPDYTAMALESLGKIAAGGVYDQLGGGFHRYSTDANWRVPHFEKMSYDQAMALSAYADAYAASHDPEFARVARSIAGYVNATLLDPKDHTFYAHQDADAFAGDDGSYYTWTAAEVKRACKPEQARAALKFFGFDDDPARAPDGRVVLRRAMDTDQLARELKMPRDRAAALLAEAKTAMFAARERRRRPQVDDAVMTDRNALMAAAYLDASAALGDGQLRKIALDDLDFILAHLRAPGGGFYHVWSNGRAAVAGLAADQVYLMNALLAAYQATDDPKYLSEARALATLIAGKYLDPASGLIADRTAPLKDNVVASRAPAPQTLYDMPMPSVQGAAAMGLATLAAITSDANYAKQAAALLAAAPALAGSAAGSTLGTLGLALEEHARGDTIVAIAGDRADRRTAALWRAALAAYRPGKVIVRVDSPQLKGGALPPALAAMYRASRGRKVPLAFVCAGTACANPVADASALAATIRSFGVASAARAASARGAGGSLALAGAPAKTSP
jgi:uncharacterized protein